FSPLLSTRHTHPAMHSPSLHDALPIWLLLAASTARPIAIALVVVKWMPQSLTSRPVRGALLVEAIEPISTQILRLARSIHFQEGDRKSTRLNSSHVSISYAVFCLKIKI